MSIRKYGQGRVLPDTSTTPLPSHLGLQERLPLAEGWGVDDEEGLNDELDLPA